MLTLCIKTDSNLELHLCSIFSI